MIKHSKQIIEDIKEFEDIYNLTNDGLEEDEEQEKDDLDIDEMLYCNQDGEAHQLPFTESAHTDYGLQNSISI